MKRSKQILALILALLMLCGLIPALAVGNTAPTEMKLVGAMPITSDIRVGSALHTNASWGDKGLAVFFNQPVPTNIGSTRCFIVVVDADNEVVNYNGTNLIWSTSRSTAELWQIRGNFLAFSSTVTIGNVSVGTWTTLASVLTTDEELAGKGYRVQLRMCGVSGEVTNNGYVDTVYNGNQKLAANLKVTSNSTPTTGGTFDCYSVDIGTAVAASGSQSAYINPINIVTLDSVTMIDQIHMNLKFSEAVTIDTARNDAVLEIVSTDGTTVAKSYAVTLSEGNAATVQATLTDDTWTQIKTDLAAAASGSYVRFKMTEKDINTEYGENLFSFVVDTVWGTETYRPLRAHTGAAAPYAKDFVICPVETDFTEVVSAVVQDVNADKVNILVTFNKPVTVYNARNWDIIMRFGNFSNVGSGATQHRPKVGQTYVNGETYNGKTYSNQIVFSFVSNGEPLAADVGILFAEYDEASYGEEWNDGQVSPSVICDKNGIGLFPNYYGSSTSRQELSFTKATLHEDAQDILSVSRTDENTVQVDFSMMVKAIDLTNVMLGSHKVVSATMNGGSSSGSSSWYLDAEQALTGVDAVLTIPGSAITTGYNDGVLGKSLTAALPLSERLAVAVEGETVILTENTELEQVQIPIGVTLDLNGYLLETNMVRATGANIVDLTNGKGGIVIAMNDKSDSTHLIELAVGNTALPLYDAQAGCYRFYSYSLAHLQKTQTNTVRFGLQIELGAAGAYSLLAEKENADIAVVLTLSSSALSEDIVYSFQAGTLAEYAVNKQRNDGKNWTIVLSVTNANALPANVALTVTPTLVSSTGAIPTGAVQTYIGE